MFEKIKTSVIEILCFIVFHLMINCADSGRLHCAGRFAALGHKCNFASGGWPDITVNINSMAGYNSVNV